MTAAFIALLALTEAAVPSPPACTSWAPIVVLDATAAPGIDPSAAAYVTDQLKRTAIAAGYLPVPSNIEPVAPAAPSSVPAQPSPDDVLRITQASHAERGLFANVSASGGQYVVYVFVASADKTGPYTAQGAASVPDLAVVTDGLVRSILPPPMQAGCAVTQPAQNFSARPLTEAGADAGALTRAASETPRYAWRLAFASESAFGLTDNFFYNQLVGVRLDRRFSSRVALGGSWAYANLKGPEGRASNWLAAAQVEYAIALMQNDAIELPLRFTAGYLPKNGPTLRLSAGARFALSDTMTLGADLFAPMFWVTHNQTVTSLDLALELGVAFLTIGRAARGQARK